MKLKDSRLASGFSQSQLSRASGVGLLVIQSIEQGARDINKAEAENLYRLAFVLGVNMEDLMDVERINIK